MSGLIAATTEGHAPESIEYSVVTQMIAAAYGQPRFSTDRNQARSVQDFRNDIESACFAGEE